MYVRAINSNANNYTTPSGKASKTVAVYTTTINSNSTNMGTVNTPSYNVISGATFTTSGNKLTIKGITRGTTTKDLKVVTATNKTGYSFSKWSVDSGTITAATTITATFTANTYTVAYNGNGATGGSTANTTATYDQNVTIASNGYTKTGYTFAGWTTKSDGSDDGYGWTNWKGIWKYVDGQYGIANRKLQLYARWTPNKYTISYNGNGATGGSTANTTATYDQNVTIASNGYTRTGYTFAGWTTKTNGTDDGYGWTNWKGTWKYVDGQYGIASGKLQLYARWTANQLNFANQTINKTFSTGTQTAGITGASNGTGSYTYIEKTEKNAAGTATNYISISGTTINIAASTPAGTYTYVITAKDNNSGVTKDATYTINVARAKNASASASNKTYNGKSQTGVTGGGITWSGTTSGIDAGTYTATATPDGNHAWSDGTTGAKTITWTMNKKTVAVTWGTTTTFNYNGNEQAPTVSAASGVTGETINVTRTTGTNAGSYTSTASISSVTGGRAKIGNYALSGNTKAFTINKVAAGNPTLTAVTATYDGKAHYVTVSGGYGGTINYRTSTNNSSWGSWSTTKPSLTNAGVLYVQAYVVGDGNHNSTGATGSVAITVNKATVTIPGSPVKQYTYNGKAQAHGYIAPSGSSIVTSGTTASATNAGTYNIVLQLANTSNYKWSDGSVTNKTVNWKINKANSANPTLTAVTANYDGKAHPVTVSGGAGGTINYRTSRDNKTWGGWTTTKPSLTNAGKIYVQAYVVGDANHNNTGVTGSVAITINKVAAGNPTLTAVTATYDGKAHYVTVSGGYGGTINYRTSTNNSSWGSWSTTKPSLTNAGVLYVQAYVVGDGNHNSTGATGSVAITVNKATVTIPGSPVKQYTYNGKAQAHGYIAPSGSSIVTSGTTASATNAGTYNIVLQLANTSNYKWSDGSVTNKTVNWKINKANSANPTLTAVTANYDGKAHPVTVSGGAGGTINYRTSTDNKTWGGWTTTKPSLTNAGKIYVQAYVVGDANHNNTSATGSVAITINKVNATMANPTLATGLVYNTRAQSLLYKAGSASGGTIKYGLGANSTTAPTSWNTSVTGTNAGTYFVWSKVDADGNHNGVAAKYIGMVTIAKATITVPGSPVKAYTYTGKAISHGYTAPTGSAIETTGTTGSATDAGTYNIVLKITNTSNYQWNDKTTANKTVNWKINPKSVAVSWGTTTFNYNGRAQAPTASASSGVTGETINVTRTSAINAGTYTSKASISSVTGGRAKAGNYTLTGNTKSFTINKVAATNPTLTSVSAKYDKNAHAITVSGGSGGTIYYRTSTDNKTWGSWSTTKPTRTSIGTTYVQAYVVGDGNHTNTSATGSATITITKPTAADVSYTPSDSSWKVENVKQALDALYKR